MKQHSVNLTLFWTLIVVHFILLVTAHTGYTTHAQGTPGIPLSEILNDDERELLLGSRDSDPVYEIIDQPVTTRQLKVQVGEVKSSDLNLDYDDDQLLLTLSSFGENFQVELAKNFYLGDDGTKRNGDPSTFCYYQGHSVNHPNSSAALSVCDGVMGFIQTSGKIYTIFPLPNRAAKKLQPSHPEKQFLHLVVRRDTSLQTFCPHALRRTKHFSSIGQSLEQSGKFPKDGMVHEKEEKGNGWSRFRRSTTGPSIIETAVFIDQALYEQMRRTFPKDTDRQLTTFVLTMMNAVQRLFQHSSLGRSPNIKLVLLEILKTQPQELHPSDNIDTYLTNFCIWQHNKRHYGRGKSPRWDHALLLSGINMYVVDESGRRKRHVVGLAPVSGMCNPLNSCTISEGTSFQTVLVAAHEMGHSLGMEHDGRQDGNHCDSDTFVMSPTLGSGKTTWSTCSRQYLDKFLKSPQANCLHTTNEHTNDLLDPPPEKLPGQMYDGDYQCSLRYGEGSRRSALQTSEEICRMLRCDTGYGSKGVSFAAHPALEGTSCGRDQWCQGGTCVPMLSNKGTLRGQVVDGSWSAWSAYSPCSSDCVDRGSSSAVGIMVSTRRCDNPRPSNGGRLCVGKDKRVVICDASRICSLLSRKLDLNEFIGDTCRQATARDSTLENSGTQFPSQENSHSCYVWCHKRGGGYMTQGWTIPDGTPCWRGYNQRNMYCVKGECQAFDCNGYSTEDSSSMQCSTSSSVSHSESPPHQPQLLEVGWTSWHKVSQCRSSCLLGGKGFQLVTRECNAITGCTGQRDSFQLCDASMPSCGLIKNVDQYATEICQRYRTKYPTVLSGKGRQLPAQAGNPHSACIVACQDRVWQDTHYQMDVYEDGKFPFGTDCSSHSRMKAYCLNGKCLQFTEEGIPVSTETGQVYEVRRYVSHIRRRDTSGANHVINMIDDESHQKNSKKWMYDSKFPAKVTKKHKKNHFIGWSSKSEFGWAVEMSECSAPCGGGIKNVTVACQTGNIVVDDGFCSGVNKPGQTGMWSCNSQPCIGRWQGGAWSACSVTCGKGVQFRDIICIQQLSTNIFSIVQESQCPEEIPPTEETCFEQTCP